MSNEKRYVLFEYQICGFKMLLNTIFKYTFCIYAHIFSIDLIFNMDSLSEIITHY